MRFEKWFKSFLGAITIAMLFFASQVFAFDKGIYLTSWTAMINKQVDYLIQQAKATGINTFVVDVETPHKAYAQNIAKIKNAGFKYVARIVVFPLGGTPDQVKSKAYWDKRWAQAQYAIGLGADAIQLDYIRYKPTQRKSEQNSKDIYEVIKYFRNKMGDKVKLQIDVFGISAHMHSLYIGQDVTLFAKSIDAICPMVYPSHYDPYRYHSERPYETITTSLKSLKDRLKDAPNVKINAFIEMFNFRYPMSNRRRVDYIVTEMQAAKDAGVDGWYAWSANNKYDLLFEALKNGGKVIRNGSTDSPSPATSNKKNTKTVKAEKDIKKTDDQTHTKNQSASNNLPTRCFPGMQCVH